MSTKTAIQWTDVVDNIIKVKGGGWWCRMISPGCANCYAARINQNPHYGGNKLAYSGAPPKLELKTDMMEGWRRQLHPKRHFVASMTDIFGDWVPEEWSFQMLDAMAAAPKQTFQLLTKRPQIMAARLEKWMLARDLADVPINIWPGTSVENQATADERIPILAGIASPKQWLSCEPLLGPITIPEREMEAISWLVVGGESGPKARPMHPDWARSLRDQCEAVREFPVAFFFKQWGEHVPVRIQRDDSFLGGYAFNDPRGGRRAAVVREARPRPFAAGAVRRFQAGDQTIGGIQALDDDTLAVKVGKKRAGRLLDGREWNEFPA